MANIKKMIGTNQMCSLPWVHADVNFQYGTISPCCKFKSTFETTSNKFKDVWFMEPFNGLRTDFLNSRYPRDCVDNCYSYKEWRNQLFVDKGILTDEMDTDDLELPKSFSIAFGKVCNLACRMCTPDNSSTFANLVKDSPKLQKFFKMESAMFIPAETLEGSFTNLEHLSLTGGEPLVDKNCLEIIKLAKKESPKLKSITLTTNMTKFNKELLNSLADTGAEINFSVSIDGPKRLHEYIRYGCRWEDIVQNLIAIRHNYPGITFSICTTSSIFNAGYVSETLDAIHALGHETGVEFKGLFTSPVFAPEHLHPRVVPGEIKERYLDRLKDNDKIYPIPGSRSLITTTQEMLNDSPSKSDYLRFVKYVTELDKLTNTDFYQVYPEFRRLI